jgi:shikimate dehydrogenase
MLTGSKLAVWGDPVAHSRSPQLHAAAYGALGLDWEYTRLRVDAESFDRELAALGPQWRGLSCTMPLKERAFAATATHDRFAELTGAVNTVLLRPGGDPDGFNTDVGGLVRALREQGVDEIGSARIVGGGRTAASAVIALAALGARRIEIDARRPEAAASLVGLGEAVGALVVPGALDERVRDRVDVTVATLAGGVVLPDAVSAALAAPGSLLLDAAYDPWPSALARVWEAHGRTAVSGIAMLLQQAVLQVRVFVGGHPDAELPDEGVVVARMRSALVGD